MLTEEERLNLWEEYLGTKFKLSQLRLKIHEAYKDQDRKKSIGLLREDLLDISKRFLLYEIIESLPLAEQKLLAEELLPLAIMLETKRSFNPAEKIISSWNKEWLKTNIPQLLRKVMERVRAGDFAYMDLGSFYWEVIGFCRTYDFALAKELLAEALMHPDQGVRESGTEWENSAER